MLTEIKRFIRQIRYQRKLGNLPASATHPCIDVGCGAFPIPGADYAMDCYAPSFDLVEMQAKLRGRFVIADIQQIPFKTGTFAFVHCSNVLEHLENPLAALRELKRIGQHGFIECPSYFYEYVLDHPAAHIWVVKWQGEEMILKSPKRFMVGNIQVFPIAYSPWIRQKLPIIWKMIVSTLDLAGVAYHYYRW